MWTFLEVFICGKKSMLSHGKHQFYFLLSLAC